MKDAIVIKTVEAAAASVGAGRRMIEAVIMFLISFGMLFRLPEGEEEESAYNAALAAWETAEKAKIAESTAKYKEARLPLIAADRDERRKDRKKTSVRSLALDAAAVRALPQNDPLKEARAAVQTTARQDVWYIRDQHRIMVREVFRLRSETLDGTPSPKPVKSLSETFAQFAKDAASRNQRSGEMNAGDLSLLLETWKAQLNEKLPKKLKLKD